LEVKVDDYTSGGGITLAWRGHAALMVVNHNMIYSLMGGLGRLAGGLNHFCDLKTCKNRIFSKEIWSHLLILDSFSLSKGRIEVN